MNDRRTAAIDILQALDRLEAALCEPAGAGSVPAGHARVGALIDRIARTRTRALPQISPEFVDLLLAHAALTQAAVAAALNLHPAQPPDRAALAGARTRMREAIGALRGRCVHIRDGGTIAG